MNAIIVSNLGKAYKQYPSKWARFIEWLFPFFGSRHQLKWVLKDLSFSVKPGEALGIIGINGAGKSTLLKMITGTVKPTEGDVVINGRVAALLELGMGFHPDFTGRQNVYMAGQLLGYSSSEIAELLPEIEEFAEIGDYIDQPVRVYSSGMQMRLAFSVATVRRPEVLIVDEALSVGDTYFQHKSFEKIRSFRGKGTTLLIVSHDKASIQSLCDKAILLSDGVLQAEGSPEDVMNFYNAMLADSAIETIKQIPVSQNQSKTISGSRDVKILSTSLCDEFYQPIDLVEVGQSVKLVVSIVPEVIARELVVGYLIKDKLGQEVFGTNTLLQNYIVPSLQKDQAIQIVFSFVASLGVGSYSISVALHRGESHIAESFEWRDLAVIFNVVNTNYPRFVGVSWIPPEIEIHK